VRNWFEGKNGPSGENLMALIRYSDAVLAMVLQLSGRRASFRPLASWVLDPC